MGNDTGPDRTRPIDQIDETCSQEPAWYEPVGFEMDQREEKTNQDGCPMLVIALEATKQGTAEHPLLAQRRTDTHQHDEFEPTADTLQPQHRVHRHLLCFGIVLGPRGQRIRQWQRFAGCSQRIERRQADNHQHDDQCNYLPRSLPRMHHLTHAFLFIKDGP